MRHYRTDSTSPIHKPIHASRGRRRDAYKKLVITGWGWIDYAYAAALVLRHEDYRGADVRGCTGRLLIDCLNESVGYQEIVILGIGLEDNPPKLVKALSKLHDAGTVVRWISCLPLKESLVEAFSPYLELYVSGEYVTEAARNRLGVPYTDIDPEYYQDEPSPELSRYHQLFEAIFFANRVERNDGVYARFIRYIADCVSSDKWTPADLKILAHYKKNGNRELIGKSDCINKVRTMIRSIARKSDVRVLILGESGTGKETVALQLHNYSLRKNEPFISFNCANVSTDLLESRFLGHEKGSFTGAYERNIGIFEQADRGTLFLDEIGELPLQAQGLLLRVLEEGRFTRIGEKEEVMVDVRIVAATNRNLYTMSRNGTFRKDLFERLAVIQIRTPSLREHKEDLPEIAGDYWLRKSGQELTKKQLKALATYDYPGNVRELYNILTQAYVLGEKDFDQVLKNHRALRGGIEEEESEELDAVMRKHIHKIYEKYGHNITKTAEALKCSLNTVRKYTRE